jgi:hypothetical protein
MRRSFIASVLVPAALLAPTATAAAVGPVFRASGPSPFALGCNGAPQTGTLYPNAEVEPWVDANPADRRNLVAVWQQDRWSNGGAQGILTAVSEDRGRSWFRPRPPTFTRCAGGTPSNGGAYERASDPWVSFGPDGTAYQIALAVDDSNPTSAVLVSRSRDGGRTWGPVATLQRNTTAEFFNDKETITADPMSPRYVYAVWDRLQTQNPDDPNSAFSGDTLFARSTDGGRTWEPTTTILDFPDNSNQQSIANQIVVLPNGTLLNVFDLIDQGTTLVAVQRSTDKGRTWSDPLIIDLLFSSVLTTQGGVIDPSDGHPVRTGDILPEAAVDPRRGTNTAYIVWQDLRFTLLGPIANDQIVLAKSTDGGLTWSDPQRVSANKNVQAFTGSVQVNARGDVGVSYYDFTADTPGGALWTDYWFTASRDGGRTFGAREALTREPFDMRTAPDALGFFVGDYEGLTSTGRSFAPVFVIANSGNTSNRTDVFSRDVTPTFAPVVTPAAAAAPSRAPVSASGVRAVGRRALTGHVTKR